ncbi:MAG: oligosaccharide flippase family protein [Granulosicoccus sp.]
MSVMRILARNIFSNYVGMIGTIVIAFLISPYLVHTLGDTKYGIWSILAALTGYMALMDLGVSSAIAKYVSEYQATRDYQALNRVIASGFALLLSVVTVLIVLSPWLASTFVRVYNFDDSIREIVRQVIIIATLDISIFTLTGIFVGTVSGLQRYDILNVVNLVSALLKALLFWYFLSHGYGLIAMAAISLAINSIIGLTLYFTITRYYSHIRLRLSEARKSTTIDIFHYSKFTFLSMLALLLVYYSDAFVIGYFLSAAAITYYTIAWSLGEYTNKMIMAISATFVPMFSEQDVTQGRDELYATYLSGTRFVLLISNLLCIGLLTLGKDFVSLWMGPEYAIKCAPILVIIFITQLIKGPQHISYAILLGTAKHREYSLYNMVFAVANLSLSIYLVQDYGIVGVATATALTQGLFFGVITPILTNHRLSGNLWHYVKETYLRALIPGVVLYLGLIVVAQKIPPQSYLELISIALVAATLYLVLCWFMLLKQSERNYLHTLFSGQWQSLNTRLRGAG